MMRKWDVILGTAAVIFALAAVHAPAQRITVDGTRFLVNGREIFLNGANTPWNRWNDFGTGNYDPAWWDSHMQVLNGHGINCIRVWISCNGGGIRINPDGTVTGVTASFFSDLDQFFGLAEEHQIYIFATLLSFDHTKSGNPNYLAYRACFNDNEKTASLVDHYVLPFVNRYQDNPYLFAIDACNEIEWVHENAEAGSIAWDRLQYLVAAMAVGVHSAGPVLFSMGSAAVKWNSDSPGEGNKWKDSALQAQLNDPKAFLDFYSPHWYGWVARWFGNPCAKSPADYHINDRPCIIGECPARGMFTQDSQGKDVLVNNPTEMYEKAWQKGWRGVFPWTSNGVDANGSIADFGSATLAFLENHRERVYPAETGVGAVPVLQPGGLRISCHPNPFNSRTVIRCSTDRPDSVRIRMFDANGRMRRTVLKGRNPGAISAWSGTVRTIRAKSCLPGYFSAASRRIRNERSQRSYWWNDIITFSSPPGGAVHF
ncbi:cellulase family glycosylhydrolase [bacterium]|nr:cellulase family glycosylhydrolase [bacterium]